MTYNVELTKSALKDISKLRAAGLMEKALKIRNALIIDPYAPSYEKLTGDLLGKYSRRINIKHRLIYEVYEEQKLVRVLRMWSHYE